MAPIDIEGLLVEVTRPARYTGGEWNAVVKAWDEAALRVLLAVPEVYEVGMAQWEMHVLYAILNGQANVLCERCFASWPDMEEAMRRRGVPAWSLESRHAVRDFDLLVFWVGQPLMFTNLVNMLDLAGLPLLARERGDGLPLVVAAGAGLLNPEPLADFVDAFLLGDGEELILDVAEGLGRWKEQGGSKVDLLRGLARVPGVYVPSFYRVDYSGDGRVTAIEAIDGAPRHVGGPAARRLAALPPPLLRPVVPLMEKVQERAIIEIQRGWLPASGLGAIGLVNRPRLERPAAEVIAAASELLANTGYEELMLAAVRATEYSQMEELAAGLRPLLLQDVAVRLVSIEAEPRAVELAARLAGPRRRWLSLAPQAGRERLRRALGPGATDEEVLRAAELALAKGWMGLRLHFFLGVPGETMEDVRAIAALAGQIGELGRRYHGGRAHVRVVVSNFVPRAHTPFQWARQATAEELGEKQEALRKALRRASVEIYLESAAASLLEGVLARGDRRLGPVIRRAWELGARLDGWRQHFDWSRWQRALAEWGLAASFYLRERPPEERLPWGHIDWGFPEEELREGWQRLRIGRKQESG